MPTADRAEPRAPDRTGAAWHPHARSVDEVLRRLGTDRDSGLTEEQVAAARLLHGRNALEEAPGVPLWRRFLRQFKALVIWILLLAAGISAALGELIDAVAIAAIVILNGVIGFLQEERAARDIAALERLSTPKARVIRAGVHRTLPTAELVPGDLVELEAGDRVPADARLIEAASLRAEESALTGESSPASKNAGAVLDPQTDLGDRANCLFMGTAIAGGHARAVVTATGMATELGRIAELLERRERRPTPLQIRMDQLGRVLVVACLGLIAVIGALQTLRGGRPLEVFVLSVSLAVAAVPEGLTAVVTVALALGLQRMARRNALVRRLPSIETLGCVRVICSDKTGTLTRNEMTVREIVAGDRPYRVTGAGYAPRGEFLRRTPDAPAGDGLRVDPEGEPDLMALLAAGAQCNDSRLRPEASGGAWVLVGDPTEGALMAAALKAGVPGANQPRDVRFEIPFEAERRSMTVVVRQADGSTIVQVKGAPEVILPRCPRERVGGAVLGMTEERRRHALSAAADMASRALRVLALAHRPDAGPGPYDDRDLVFLGLVGMIDPPREESAAAVQACRDAGIKPVMITGDHPATALSIARELGIAGERDRAVAGHELDALGEADLERRVESIPVYARVSAEHKLRVVRAWRKRGFVVAMTGDGVNDAPAVQLSDIGIAMGRRGTDVTREVADMVLVDDNFASIVAAVEEGRGIFDNIQKVVHYLLATNAGEVMLMFFAALAGWPVPLAATQILWINLVTDGAPALALGVEPPEPGIMSRAPRADGTPIISRREGGAIVLRGALVAAVAAAGFALAHGGDPANLPHARAVAFSVTGYSQLLYSFAFRSQRLTLAQIGLFTNPALLGAMGVAGLLLFGAVELPFMQALFGMSRPLGGDWLLVVGLSILPVTLVEIGKIVRAAFRRRGN